MEFIIQKESKEKKMEEGFYVDIDLMGGDADYYDKIRLGVFTEKEKSFLEELINLLDELKKVPSGYEDEKYHKVKNFDAWFYEGKVDENDPKYDFLLNKLSFHSYSKSYCWGWTTDDMGRPYSLEGYEVFHVNEHGNKLKVTVKK